MFFFTTDRFAKTNRRPVRALRYCLICLLVTQSLTAGQSANENEVKAVYLYNFASFVSWPESPEHASDQLFRICALGENPVSQLLPKVIEGEKIHDRTMVFQIITDSDNPKNCQILFVASKDRERVAAVLNKVRNQPILTVGEQSGFAREGGHIEFGLSSSRIRLIINRQRIDRSGLRVSAKLYRLAEVLEPEEPTKP